MKIAGTGLAIPETAVTGEEVERRLGLEPGWIERRTGVRRMPTAGPSVATSDLAIRAGADALARSAVSKQDLGLLILATSTPDHLLPPTSPLVAHALGLPQAGAVDLAGACAGFLYALVFGSTWADAFGRSVLVTGANVLTRRVDPDDPGTASLFSDGAGAVILTPEGPTALLGAFLGSEGSAYEAIGIASGGSRDPLTVESLQAKRHLMTMRRGSSLFKHAVEAMRDAGEQALRAAGLQASEIDWWIPHQANRRIIQECGRLLRMPAERTVSVVSDFANSSAASIPVALAHAERSGLLRQGQRLLLTAAGAGIVSAAAVIRWR